MKGVTIVFLKKSSLCLLIVIHSSCFTNHISWCFFTMFYLKHPPRLVFIHMFHHVSSCVPRENCHVSTFNSPLFIVHPFSPCFHHLFTMCSPFFPKDFLPGPPSHPHQHRPRGPGPEDRGGQRRADLARDAAHRRGVWGRIGLFTGANVGNGWVAGGCWDHSLLSTSKFCYNGF